MSPGEPVAAHTEALVEMNEKWSCPSPRVATAMAEAGATLVAGRDIHHCRTIGVYGSVARTAGTIRA